MDFGFLSLEGTTCVSHFVTAAPRAELTICKMVLEDLNQLNKHIIEHVNIIFIFLAGCFSSLDVFKYPEMHDSARHTNSLVGLWNDDQADIL